MAAITTALQLHNIRFNLGGDYVLSNDIDLSGYPNWDPIGTLANPFTGTFDGNGHTISNLTINRPAQDNVGLFGVINTTKAKHAPGDNSVLSEPIVRNLLFTNASVKGRDNVGILTGQHTTDVGEGNDHTVTSGNYGFLCQNIVVVGAVNGRSNVGGLLGKASGPLYAGHGTDIQSGSNYYPLEEIIGIDNIMSYATVTGTGNNVGGIAGTLSAVRPNRCSMNENTSGANNVGGIVGHLIMAPAQYCYSYGDVNTTGYVAGGIIGYSQNRGNIRHCYSKGNVRATGRHSFNYSEGETAFSKSESGTGGIIGVWGQMGGIISCCSYGDIEGERAGGLIGTGVGGGFTAPTFGWSFSRGNVYGYTAAGSMMGLHHAFGFPDDRYGSGGLVQVREFYSTGSVSGNNAGAVIGHKGPEYNYRDYQPHFPSNWEPCYKGEVKYWTPALITNMASTTNGGLRRNIEEMKREETYRVAWPQGREDLEFNNVNSGWLLNPDIDPFPILKWAHKPRTTMISAIHSKQQGLILGYVQASKVSTSFSFHKKVHYRKKGPSSWLAPLEINLIDNPDPRLGMFATDDGRIGAILNKDGALYMTYSNPGTLAITNNKDTGLEGIYGGLTELGNDGTRLFYYMPEVDSLVRSNVQGGGTWENVSFAPPGVIDTGLRISFLRAKRYVNRDRAFLTFRSDGRHIILFPDDVVWNEEPPLPIPGEDAPKFNLVITVLDEDDSPLEGTKVTITKLYEQPSETRYTSGGGMVIFELPAWNYWITVEKNGYIGVIEEPIVVTGTTDKQYILPLHRGTTVFNVSDSEGPVQDATIVYDGSTQQTNALGEAMYPEKPYGNYPYEVSKETYATEYGEVFIDNASMIESVTLEKIHITRARLLKQLWFGVVEEDDLRGYTGKLSDRDIKLIGFLS